MPNPQILYNGKCPVCSAGIRQARRLSARPVEECGWIDVTQTPDALARHGLTLRDVQYRLHVLDAQGDMQVGVPACAALWDDMPRYRWLARLMRLPVIRTIAAGLYEALAYALFRWNGIRGRN